MHRDQRGRRGGHKDLQVCRQVYDALTYALAELDDPIVDELVLARVTPAPNAARVQVILVPSHDGIDSTAALERLHEVAAELREEVAAEVSRRRVPELVFRIGTTSDMPD
jgi:ribosome-binding factor A